MPLVPRDRDECTICLHSRDDHAPHCVFSSHEIDVRWLREKEVKGDQEQAA